MPVLILISGYYVNPQKVFAIGPESSKFTRIYHSGNDGDYLVVEMPMSQVLTIWEEAAQRC